MLFATVGTTLIGPGTGVIGNPPLVPIPGRPRINGVDVALVGDLVQFVYSDVRGTQVLTITPALASTIVRVSNLPVALQGTVMSDPEVTIGVPPQVLVQAAR